MKEQVVVTVYLSNGLNTLLIPNVKETFLDKNRTLLHIFCLDGRLICINMAHVVYWTEEVKSSLN
jgi:hypothetical protein